MDQELRVDKEGKSSSLHAVLGVADEVHEFISDNSKTYVVNVGKLRYHKTKTRGWVAFEVEVNFEVEVVDHMQIIVSPLPYCRE